MPKYLNRSIDLGIENRNILKILKIYEEIETMTKQKCSLLNYDNFYGLYSEL
jgi:hypothetical protein